MQPTPIRPFLLLLAAVGATSLPEASADVLVEVDPGAPFTEGDLARAVDLRTPAATGDIVIRIARLGTDQLAVIVGDRSQVVTLPDRDRAASSRVVALVVTSMLDGSQVADAEEPVIAEVTPPAPVPARRTWLQAGTTISRDDNGYWIPFVNVGVARALAPNLRLVGSLGLARHDGYLATSSVLVPVRVGVEGRAGAAAIELGAQVLNFRERSCGVPEWGDVKSAYGAAKVFAPLGARSRLVGELGGHFAVGNEPTTCNSASNYTAYGGWLGAGIEWTS